MNVKRMFGIGAVAAAVVFALRMPAGAQETDDARDSLHRDAYVAIVKAEQARDEGSYANSVELFAAALDTYRQISRDYPGWRSGIIEARISYCINELKALMRRSDMQARFGDRLKPLVDAPVPRYEEPRPGMKTPPADEAVETDAGGESTGGESAQTSQMVEELLRERPSEENAKGRETAMEEAMARDWSAAATKSAEKEARVASRGLRAAADQPEEIKRLNEEVARKEREIKRAQEKCADLQKDLDEAQRTAEKYRKEAKPRTATQRERDLETELARLRKDMFQMATKQVTGAREDGASSAVVPPRSQAELAALKEECEDLRAENENLKKQCSAAMDAKADAEKRAGQAMKATSSGSSREKALAAELEKLQRQLRDYAGRQEKQDASDAENEGLRKELTALTKQYDRLKVASDTLKKQYDDLVKRGETGSRAPAPSSSSSEREKALQNEISRLRAEVYELASRENAGKPAPSATTQGKDTKNSRVKKDDKRYEVLKAEYERVLKENEDLKDKIAAASKRDQKRAVSASAARPAPQVEKVPAKKVVVAAEPANRARVAPSQDLETAAPAAAREPQPVRAALDKAEEGGSEANAKAISLLRENKLDEARALLDAELAKLPDDPDLLYLYGMLYCKQGDFNNAAKVLKGVADADPSNARARVALGGAYIAMRDYVNARMELEMAVGFDPDMAEAHYDLAQVLLVGTPSDPEGASEQYNEAIQLGAQPDPAFEARLAKALGK